MNFAIEKAFFDKKNVIALIEALPEYMQEDAFLIAVGAYKQEPHTKIGTKGIKDKKVYVVTDFSPFSGVLAVNIDNEKDSFRVSALVWRGYNNEYKQYVKEQQAEYIRKEEELREEYNEKIK